MMKWFMLMALGSSFFFWGDQRQKGIEIRDNAAKEWSGEDAQFVATGIDNEALAIFLPVSDHVSCDAIMTNMAADKETRWQLQTRGFKTLQCGDSILVLRFYN